MSRVGKTLIKIPAGVKVEVIYGYTRAEYNLGLHKNSAPVKVHDDTKRLISVTGPKGILVQEIRPCIWIEFNAENTEMSLKRENDESETKALHGLYNRLIQNMIKGVVEGFTKTLILNGVGYKAALKGEDLNLSLGYSHPLTVKAESGVKFKVLNPTEIQAMNLGKDGIGAVVQVTGASKEQVGSVASRIRSLRKVEPYHLYGVRYAGEHVVRKESKSGKAKKK